MKNKDKKNPHLRGTLSPLQDIDQLRTEWLELQTRSDCSFFTSWAWIGSWLDTVKANAKLHIYRCHHEGVLIGLGVLCEIVAKKRGFLPYREFSLNECHLPGCNFWVEYNGLLVARGHAETCWKNFFYMMRETDLVWHEVVLSAVDPDVPGYYASTVDRSSVLLVDAEWEPWCAELSEEDAEMAQLLTKFSSNRRWQIRRSLKEYESDGPVALDEARDLDEALSYFTAMGELHTARWNSVGEAGSFANSRWVDFHRSLIKNSFADGVVQLLRLSCGARAIGYIYNFIWRDTVCVLQNGFVMEKDNVRKPGYVAHCMAMSLNAGRRFSKYDFMMGEAQYKKSLATQGHPMLWIRIQKKMIRFRLLALAEDIYRFLCQKLSRRGK